MTRVSPNLILLGLGLALFLLIMSVTLQGAGLIPGLPAWYYRVYFMVLGMFLFWWPVDLLIHWEKRTAASFEKDRYIAMAALTIILIVFPYLWFGAPLWPTLGGAVTLGIVVPLMVTKYRRSKWKRIDVDPKGILDIAMRSPRAEEFRRYFPHYRCYVFGLSQDDGDRAHVILHHRAPCKEIENAQIDYVMDISVDRRLGIYIGGKEQLQCYFFTHAEDRSYIGFLPSANIGRTLDFGFSEAEMERAIEEAEKADQRWGKLGEKPLIVQHYPGRVVEIGR